LAQHRSVAAPNLARRMKIALISNDASGSAGDTDVEQVLTDSGAEVETFEIADGDRAGESGADRIVVAGGDGSLAVGALAACAAGVPLGVVPCGTANDFAVRMELPEDIEEAAKLAASGANTRKVDIAEAGERAFLNVASLGLAPAAAEAAENLKDKLGPLSYALGAVRAGATEEPFDCRVLCDDDELFDGDAWQVTVGSTGAFGGGSQIDADADDGLLDVVVIEGGPRAKLAQRAFGLRRGGVEEQAGVHDGRCARIVVSVGPGHDLNVDGELVPAADLGHDGSETGEIVFSIRARELELVIP